MGSEAADDALEEVLSVDARGLDEQVLVVGQRELGVDLAQPRDVELEPVRRDERHVREAPREGANLESLREPRIASGHEHGHAVLPGDLDDRVDACVGDAERLLPGMQEEAAQAELVERLLELGARLVAEQRVDARDSRQPAGAGRHRLGNRLVGGAEVVAAGLDRADDRPVDPELVHAGHELDGARRAPEERLADKREAVDDQRTPSRMRTALPAKTRASASGAKPASRTFSTSIRGEHAGPSLA